MFDLVSHLSSSASYPSQRILNLFAQVGPLISRIFHRVFVLVQTCHPVVDTGISGGGIVEIRGRGVGDFIFGKLKNGRFSYT